MSVIKCEQRGCAHNSDCKCAKKRVDVCTGGRDCKTVFCASYRPRRRIEAGELANEIGSRACPAVTIASAAMRRAARTTRTAHAWRSV